MTPKLYLSLAIHNHQPVGNFGWVFEEAYKTAYLPMLECLERHPTIRAAQHYTGPLRDWLVENKPDFFPRVRELVARGQIEILSGSYYEAILVALRDADKIGQIRKLTEAVKDDFGYEASGMWLAERIWEPHLARPIHQAGMKYAIVDDSHFKAVGFTDSELFGYYVTEEQGSPLKIFGTSMQLRYSIPWTPVELVIDGLREQAQSPGPVGLYDGKTKVAVFGDDGEKFGMWPGTYQTIWIEGWMDRFFEAIEANSDWLETITPGDFAREHPSLGRVYLPAASYEEMGEWSLPPDAAWDLPAMRQRFKDENRTDVLRYLRGGLWRNFLVKYPEINQLHKKSLWVSDKVHAMPDGPDKREALDLLWAGQCNCGYWHGVFGGIYLFHIRNADYEKLIQAENLADRAGGLKPSVQVDIVDFDLDAMDDVVVTSDRQTLVFDLDKGGAVVEWDLRPIAYNLVNVLTRRREGYHQTLVDAAQKGWIVTPEMQESEQFRHPKEIVRAREMGLEQQLIYDWHRRSSFLDHFLHPDATLDGYRRSSYPEEGDFVNQPYQCELNSHSAKRAVLRLWRDGQVWQDGRQIPVRVEKTFAVAAGTDQVSVEYVVTNRSDGMLTMHFGVETDWGLAGGNEEHTYFSFGDSQSQLDLIGSQDSIPALAIVSELWKIQMDIKLGQPANIWHFPLEAISNSEGGFERNYQGTVMLTWWPMTIEPGEKWTNTLTFDLKYL